VPIQRNSKEEKEQIKKGEIPASFSANPHVLAQKDCDARWGKKGNENYFGYENHDLIEHVFGSQKMRMGDETLRSIGFARARFWIGIRNLVYNLSRFVSLKRPKKVPKVA
jgi:hypothetical protein